MIIKIKKIMRMFKFLIKFMFKLCEYILFMIIKLKMFNNFLIMFIFKIKLSYKIFL